MQNVHIVLGWLNGQLRKAQKVGLKNVWKEKATPLFINHDSQYTYICHLNCTGYVRVAQSGGVQPVTFWLGSLLQLQKSWSKMKALKERKKSPRGLQPPHALWLLIALNKVHGNSDFQQIAHSTHWFSSELVFLLPLPKGVSHKYASAQKLQREGKCIW